MLQISEIHLLPDGERKSMYLGAVEACKSYARYSTEQKGSVCPSEHGLNGYKDKINK